jgi:hypothetical protein
VTDFKNVTTAEAVATYTATNGIFNGLIREVRELSKKKPDATLNGGKVKIINRVLTDLKDILDKEPEGKFLDLLDDQELPQTSDAVLVMVQYETVLRAFSARYRQDVQWDYSNTKTEWITPEVVAEYTKLKAQPGG